MTERSNVPCNGCTVCCRSRDLIVIHPEDGDVLADYDTQPIAHPFTGEPAHALKHKPNGHCIYLTDAGCSIHERAPAVCRGFDWRTLNLRFLQGTNRAERRKAMASGVMLNKQILKEARKRLDTL